MESNPDGMGSPRRWHERAAGPLLFAFAFAFLFPWKVAQERRFRLNDFDTGIYSNVAWNIAHGRGFRSEVLDRNHLGEHFSPITAVAAPLYLVSATPLWLLALQSAAVAMCLPLAHRLARLLLPESIAPWDRQWAIVVVLALVMLYRPLARAHLFQFHPSTLGVPFLFGAILAMHEGRRAAYWICVAALLTTKELAIASVSGLAMYALLVLGDRRLFVQTAAIAAVAAALILGLIMPAFREEAWGHASRIGPLADIPEKGKYLWLLLLGLGLLPIAGWRALACAVPLLGVNLSTAHEAQYSLKYHYDDQASAFLVVAAIHGAANLLGRQWPAFMQSRRRVAFALACAGALSCAVFVLGDAYAEQWRNLAKMRRSDELRTALRPYIEAPRSIGVASQSGLGPYLAHRDRYVSLAGDGATDRLRAGDLIVLSPHAGTTGLDLEAATARYAADARAREVLSTDLLRVWEWGEPGPAG